MRILLNASPDEVKNMNKIILGVAMIVFGIAFMVFNKKWSEWVYENTQRFSYSFVSFLLSQARYEKYCIVFDRFGLVF
jgi:glucose uptake protein GlcU